MLRHRIIPMVLLDGYSVVKTIQFDVRRNLGNPITVARIYNARNVDELILLDIDASRDRRRIDMDTIADVASECRMPLCVGGGIKTLADIADALAHGADKVAINSGALENPALVEAASRTFGSQCIVVSIDVKLGGDGAYAVHTHTGAPEHRDPLEWARRAEELGCGEILLNSVDRDGTMSGYDVELVSQVTSSVSVPVIAAGGAGSPEHICRVIEAGGASAAAAASLFHFTSETPLGVKQYLAAKGMPVRP